MRLYKFLNEKEIGINISEKDCIKLLKTKCLNTINEIKNNNMTATIFRGIPSSDKFIHVKDVNRKSANVDNYYTLLFSDILDSWKNIPKRNKSLICTTDEKYSKQYGSTYYVIPYDNSDIAVAYIDDFWYIMDNNRKLLNVTKRNDFLNIKDLRDINLLFKNERIDDSLSSMNSVLNKTMFEIKNSNYSEKFKEFHMRMLLDYNSFKKIDDDLLNKITLKFLYNIYFSAEEFRITTMKYKDIKRSLGEVWTEGNSILLHEDYAKNILYKTLN